MLLWAIAFQYRYSTRLIGIGGGGALFTPNVNPVDKDNFVASCDMGALYTT